MSQIEKKRLIRCLCVILPSLIAAICFLVVITKLNVGFALCPVRALTGFNCPGCGNTRAMIALLHLRFLESLSYNYAYPIEFSFLLFVVVMACKNYVKEGKLSYYPKRPAAVCALLVLLVVWGVVRNFFGV